MQTISQTYTRCGQDYAVDQQHLPKGLMMFDTIKIEYPHDRSAEVAVRREFA